MRFSLPLGAVALALGVFVVAVGACDDDKPERAQSTPTPTPTLEQVLVGVADLPGCTQEGDNVFSFYEGTLSRAFACPNNDRITYDLILHQTEDEARKNQDNGYGTMDGARDIIEASLKARPVNMASLTVTDVTSSFGSLGSDQLNVYCASYSDFGSTRVTEYYGAFRYKRAIVQFRSWATSGGSCDAPGRALTNAQSLAIKQLQKLRATLPP